MENLKKISYAVKRFENSKDKDFMKALQIYNDSIPVDTKTSTNEIIYFADNWNLQANRLMYFFGLYIDNEVIGYVEAGYLVKTKVIIPIIYNDCFFIFYCLLKRLQNFHFHQ